jgi:cytochrome c6
LEILVAPIPALTFTGGPRRAALLLTTWASLLMPIAAFAQAAPDASRLALGKALFTKEAAPPCATCHALKDAGAQGAVGPSLDDLQPDASRVATAVRDGLGVMPPYKATLSDAQIQALAAYVARASAASK